MNSKKIFKLPKGALITTIIFAILATTLILVGIETDKPQENETPSQYHTLISNDSDNENQYVKVTITELPYQFAIRNEGGTQWKYYILFDKDNYMYLSRLTSETFNKLEELYNKNQEEFSYELEGYIFNTPEDLKKIAMETYNEQEPAEIITDENFTNYFGKSYLDETYTPNSPIAETMITIGAILGISAIIIFIAYICIIVKFKKTIQKYNKEELEEELEKETTISYPTAKIYLTDKYIITKANTLDIIPYEDLYWIYIEKRKYNGVNVGKYLIAKMKNKKTKQIAVVHKSEELLIEITNKIHEKNDSVLIGFTPENQKAFKDFAKN